MSASLIHKIAGLLAAAAVFPCAAAGSPPWTSAIAGTGNSRPPSAVTAEIVSPGTAAVPGRAYRIGILMKHSRGWHTYWRFPGDSGYPTTVTWSLPAGWNPESLGWPLPERVVTGGITTFEHGGEILLPYEIKVPAVDPGTDVPVSVKLDFLACSNICVPGEASASFTIKTAKNSLPSGDSGLFDRAVSSLPSRKIPDGVRATLQDGVITLTLPPAVAAGSADFYPAGGGQAVLKEIPRFSRNPDGSAQVVLKAHRKLLGNPRTAISGVLLVNGGPARGGAAFYGEIPLEPGQAAAPAQPGEGAAPETGGVTGPDTGAGPGSAAAMLLAFIGGLILNVMPCVFPVIALKIVHLVSSPKKRGVLLAHGIAFSAGILACMLILALALAVLRSLGMAMGWGFQLQSPVVVTILILLFTAIALNLAGIFEFTAFTLPAGTPVMKRLPTGGLAGSFCTGLLTVVVASPCTAPFMGTAVGYALTQGTVEAVSVFLALGSGMALPWLLLTAFPFWAGWLPKPGPWMEVFRKAMAVPLAAAVAWLIWVLSRQLSPAGMSAAIAAVALASCFLWLLGRRQYGRSIPPFAMTVPLLLCLGSVLLVASGIFDEKSPGTDSQWRQWSPQAVSREVASGRPVVVDFTAAWCLTCQFNEASAIRTDRASQAMDRLGYARFVADWTNRDERISGALAEHGRSGVPLYLLYDRGGRVTILPELITETAFIRALEENAQR